MNTFSERFAKHRIALKAPINSSSLMCRSQSVDVQGPLAVAPLEHAPQPDNEASDCIIMSGSAAKNVLPFTTSREAIHHERSSLA